MPDILTNQLITYAQNREDILLGAILRGAKKGFYVDVGANHPVRESVTKHFYSHGWRGMNIEPSPRLHALLQADRPRDINLMVGVSNKKGELTFRDYEYGDGLSTFSAEMQQLYEKSNYYYAGKYKEYAVPVTTLADIFKDNKVSDIAFLKIDVEGYEYEVLAGNNWREYRPRVICIEANHIVKDWHPLLEEAGYQKLFADGLNEYLVRREDKDLISKFSYADDVLLAPQFVKWEIRNECLDIDRQRRQAVYRLSQAESRVNDLVEQLSRPTASSSTGIRSRIKSFMKGLDRKIETRLTHTAVKPQPLPAGLLKTDDSTFAQAISRTIRGALEKQYRANGQVAAHYYRRTRHFLIAKRGRR